MPKQRAEFEAKDRHRAFPSDAERFSLGLEDDNCLDWAKLGAGVLSIVALVAMLITSLFRAPNPAWTVLLAIVAAWLCIAIGVRLVQHRTDWRQ